MRLPIALFILILAFASGCGTRYMSSPNTASSGGNQNTSGSGGGSGLAGGSDSGSGGTSGSGGSGSGGSSGSNAPQCTVQAVTRNAKLKVDQMNNPHPASAVSDPIVFQFSSNRPVSFTVSGGGAGYQAARTDLNDRTIQISARYKALGRYTLSVVVRDANGGYNSCGDTGEIIANPIGKNAVAMHFYPQGNWTYGIWTYDLHPAQHANNPYVFIGVPFYTYSEPSAVCGTPLYIGVDTRWGVGATTFGGESNVPILGLLGYVCPIPVAGTKMLHRVVEIYWPTKTHYTTFNLAEVGGVNGGQYASGHVFTPGGFMYEGVQGYAPTGP